VARILLVFCGVLIGLDGTVVDL